MSEEATSDGQPESASSATGIGGQSTPGGPKTRPRPATPKPSELATLDQLFEFFFASEGKRVAIPQKTWKTIEASIETGPPIVDIARRIGDLTRRDPLLRVPPRILITLENSYAPKQLSAELIGLLQYGLMAHPLFAAIADRGSPWDADPDSTMTRLSLAVGDLSARDLGIKAEKVPTADREKLRWNALLTTALMSSSLRDLPVEVFVELLERQLWQPAVRRSGSPPIRVAIGDATNAEALAAVAEVFKARSRKAEAHAVEADRRAMVAENSASVSHQRAMTAEGELTERDAELARRQSTIAALRSDLDQTNARVAAEQRDRAIDKGHHADDYEILRTRVARSVARQVDLLSDGLHALQHKSYGVTEEYLERAIESLSKELKQLQEDTGDG